MNNWIPLSILSPVLQGQDVLRDPHFPHMSNWYPSVRLVPSPLGTGCPNGSPLSPYGIPLSILSLVLQGQDLLRDSGGHLGFERQQNSLTFKQFVIHNVIVHCLCHDFCDCITFKLNKCIASGPSSLMVKQATVLTETETQQTTMMRPTFLLLASFRRVTVPN